VLIVDDDEPLLAVTAEVLSRLGYAAMSFLRRPQGTRRLRGRARAIRRRFTGQ